MLFRSVDTHSDYFMVESFHGSLIFSHHHEDMVEFMKFVQTVNPYKYPEDNYLPKFWHLFFKCSFSKFDCQLLENCQPNASLDLLPRHLFDPAMSEEGYNIYSAVYTVAYRHNRKPKLERERERERWWTQISKPQRSKTAGRKSGKGTRSKINELLSGQ